MTTSDRDRRLVRVEMSEELVSELFRDGTIVRSGLPDDATLIRIHEIPARQTREFVFRSDEFPALAEGENIPLVGVQYECHFNTDTVPTNVWTSNATKDVDATPITEYMSNSK